MNLACRKRSHWSLSSQFWVKNLIFRAAVHRRFISTEDVSKQLAYLIKKSDIHEANKFRIRIQDQGLQIPPNSVYRTAAALVLQQPDYLRHSATFEAWLSLCPHAKTPDERAFPRVCRILLAEPVKNMPLLLTFATQCIRKGYIRLAREGILPTVARFGNSQMVDKLNAELRQKLTHKEPDALHTLIETALTEPTRNEPGAVHTLIETTLAEPTRDEPDAVHTFIETALTEPTRDDLHTLMETALADPQPFDPVPSESPGSYMTIENALPALLPKPRDNDTAIFEDESFYDYPTSYLPPTSRRTPLEHLTLLIESGQYDEAKRILHELLDLGVPIPPSYIYEKAAQYALGLPLNPRGDRLELDYAQRLEDFSMWFSLIPEYDPTAVYDFAETKRHLFAASITQLDIIIQFGLICAAKGHYEVVSSPVLSAITLYADPSVSMRFFERMEDSVQQWIVRDKGKEQSKFHVTHAWSYIRGLGIRGFARAGHLREALSLLPDPYEQNHLSTYTYTYLLKRLTGAGPEYEEAATRVERLREANDSRIGMEHVSSMSNLVSAESEAPQLQSLGDGLVASLKNLKKSLKRGNRLPHALLIMNFIEEYIDLGRWKALGLLRKVAFRSGYASAAKLIFAQMLYNYHHGNYRQVIQEFSRAFYLTGVPRDEIITVLREMEGEAGLIDPSPLENWDIRAGKLFPNPYHCSIVWHALVALSATPSRVEVLYRKLLAFASGQIEDQLPSLLPSYSEVTPLVPPPVWINKVAVSSFTPFMRPLMFHGSASRGPKMIREILALGLKPDVYHFTELAGFYAHTGDKKQALFILDRMEAQLASEKAQNPSAQDADSPTTEGKAADSSHEPSATSESKSSISLEKPPATPEPHPQSAVSPDDASPTHPTPAPSPAPRPNNTSIPTPSMILYISLMRNFLHSEHLDAVEEVNRRFLKHFKYVPGMNDYLDRIYEDWDISARRKGRRARIQP